MKRSRLAVLILAAGLFGVGEQGSATPTLHSPEAAAPSWSERASAFSGLEWVTRPSRDAVMSFTLTAEVKEVVAKPGQRVKKGDVLVRARDTDVTTAIAVQTVRANNHAEIDAAKASLDLATSRYERIKEADTQKATNQQELDERRVSVDAAKANLAAAEARFAEEQARLKQLEEQASRYRIDAPFDGVIDNVLVDVGATIEPPAPVLRIVNVDVLWIDLPTPTEVTLAKGLKAGDAAWVMLESPDAKVVEGRIQYVSPVADAAAGTRRVRVEVKSEGVPPGTRARVRFEKPVGESAPTIPVRRGVVAHGAASHDPSACVQCAKTIWQRESGKEEPVSVKRPGGWAGEK